MSPQSPGTIPLTGPGSLAPTRERRWAESFGIALAPFIGITIGRFISSGFTPSLLSPVDLSFAMLSAAAVLAVQLVNDQDRQRAGTVPTLVYIVIFAIAFTATAIATTNRVESHRGQLANSALESTTTLKKIKAYLNIQAIHRNQIGLARLKDRVAAALAALSGGTTAVNSDSGFTRELILTMLFSAFFLVFALRVWSQL